MRFILGLLVGYCIRGKQRLLIGTLTAIAIVVFIVLPAMALSQLAISVRRERLSRPPQTVPAIVGLDYKTAQIKLRKATLDIPILAARRDLPLEPGMIVTQTPKGGERVDCGTVIGVIVSGEHPTKNPFSPRPHNSILSRSRKNNLAPKESAYKVHKETASTEHSYATLNISRIKTT